MKSFFVFGKTFSLAKVGFFGKESCSCTFISNSNCDDSFVSCLDKSSNSESNNFVNDIKDLRRKNIDKVLIGNINVNSIPHKFDQLKELILKYVDVLIITETKLDDSFPTAQFKVEGFSEPFRRDRNRKGGGIMIYVRNDILCRALKKYNFESDVEALFLELNFRKSKWLLCGIYHPPSQSKEYFFNNLDNALDPYPEY